MMFARLALVAWLLVPAVSFAQRSDDEAGDTSEIDKDSAGPLRERVRPVSGHALLMKGRFEVSPGIGISVRDAFFTKFFLSGEISYHFLESFGVRLRGGYNFVIPSGAAQICESNACRVPTVTEMSAPGTTAYGQLGLVAGLDLEWSPIYGKLSLIAEKALEFNLYGTVGPYLVQYVQAGPASVFTAGGNVGIGFRFFFNRFMTLRLELRDLIYYEATAPGATLPGSLRNQLYFELGLSFFLPTSFTED